MPTSASTPVDRRIPGDGVTLHSLEWPGGGAPIVLLHGLASNARIWHGVGSRLAGAGFHVVAFDLRGHGESDQPEAGYDFASVAGDLEAALGALGLAGPVLVGHSWGANVALQYAADRPGGVAGLVMVDGGFLAVADWAGPDREAARQLLAPPRFAVPLDEWLARAGRFAPPGSGADGWLRDFLRAGVEVDDRGVATARFHFDNHMQVVDALYDQRPEELFARVACPALLCPAGGDLADAKRAGVARALAALADARVVWFDDSVHDIPLHRPERLAAELARFAGEVARRG